MATIQNMTLEDLRQLIDERVAAHLAATLNRFALEEDAPGADEPPDTRTWEQVKADIERDRWTPPPGAKPSLTLLREDRER